MNNSFLSRFAPKEPKFFPLLKNLSDALLSATEILKGSLHSTNLEERKDFYQKIKEQERRGDQISKEIFEQLGISFITPFDREDIHQLADYLDDVIDNINSCAKRIAIYNPKKNTPDCEALGLIVRKDAICLGKAMDELENLRKNADKLKEHCVELHDLENQADDIYEEAITRLFREESDSIEIIKTKEILNELEKATDAAERVGKILRTIIVKYA